jgi:hypothetical protein
MARPPQGYIMPQFHKKYWVGLRKPTASDPFSWFDPYALPLSNSSAYQHWGTYTAGDGITSQEPNNIKPPEYCTAANWTEAYNGSWGWADTRCSFNLTYICKVIRERPASGCACKLIITVACCQRY